MKCYGHDGKFYSLQVKCRKRNNSFMLKCMDILHLIAIHIFLVMILLISLNIRNFYLQIMKKCTLHSNVRFCKLIHFTTESFKEKVKKNLHSFNWKHNHPKLAKHSSIKIYMYMQFKHAPPILPPPFFSLLYCTDCMIWIRNFCVCFELCHTFFLPYFK